MFFINYKVYKFIFYFLFLILTIHIINDKLGVNFYIDRFIEKLIKKAESSTYIVPWE